MFLTIFFKKGTASKTRQGNWYKAEEKTQTEEMTLPGLTKTSEDEKLFSLVFQLFPKVPSRSQNVSGSLDLFKQENARKKRKINQKWFPCESLGKMGHPRGHMHLRSP